jgi:hypothetical protein
MQVALVVEERRRIRWWQPWSSTISTLLIGRVLGSVLLITYVNFIIRDWAPFYRGGVVGTNSWVREVPPIRAHLVGC